MKPLSFLILLSIAACHAPAPKNIDYDHSYALTGRITGYPEGEVYLQHLERNGQIQKAVIEDSVFTFTGTSSAPEYCRLGFPVRGGISFRIGFFLQNGRITCTGHKDSLNDNDIRITGSPAQDEYRNIARKLAAIDTPDIRRKYINAYARQHPSSYVAAYEINSVYSSGSDAKELDTLYSSLDKSVQSSWYGQQISNTLVKLQQTDIGRTAPAFSLPDADGKDIALSSYKGRLVLVDFWASWCTPCRKENPHYLKAWQQFHQKGFDILGVSLDNNKEKWLEAIKTDNLPWTQLADLNGWQNQAAQLYGIRGIPMNYLLDKDGKIIAKNLRGDALEKHLTGLLK